MKTMCKYSLVEPGTKVDAHRNAVAQAHTVKTNEEPSVEVEITCFVTMTPQGVAIPTGSLFEVVKC